MNKKQSRFLSVFFILTLFAAAWPQNAYSACKKLEKLSLTTLLMKADVIFIGEEISSSRWWAGDLPFTAKTYKVIEPLHGLIFWPDTVVVNHNSPMPRFGEEKKLDHVLSYSKKASPKEDPSKEDDSYVYVSAAYSGTKLYSINSGRCTPFFPYDREKLTFFLRIWRYLKLAIFIFVVVYVRSLLKRRNANASSNVPS